MFRKLPLILKSVSLGSLGILLVSLTSCSSPEFDNGICSSEKIYMHFLVSHLEKSGIKYSDEKNGCIKYRSSDEKQVEEIDKQLKNMLSHYVSGKYKERKVRKYIKILLRSKNMEFYEETRPDGIWISWFPKNEEQRKRIQMQVVQFVFDSGMAEKRQASS